MKGCAGMAPQTGNNTSSSKCRHPLRPTWSPIEVNGAVWGPQNLSTWIPLLDQGHVWLQLEGPSNTELLQFVNVYIKGLGLSPNRYMGGRQ